MGKPFYKPGREGDWAAQWAFSFQDHFPTPSHVPSLDPAIGSPGKEEFSCHCCCPTLTSHTASHIPLSAGSGQPLPADPLATYNHRRGAVGELDPSLLIFLLPEMVLVFLKRKVYSAPFSKVLRRKHGGKCINRFMEESV